MSEENVINISGVDFGMIGYYRLDDKRKGVFSTVVSGDSYDREKYGKKPRAEKCEIESDVKNKDSIRRYRLKLHEDIVFDTSSLIQVKYKNTEELKRILGVSNIGIDSYCVNISKKNLIDIQSKFKKADVLFFSGHHYADNFHEDYCMPGLLNNGFYNDREKLTASFSLQSLFPVLDQEENFGNAEYNVYDNVKLVVSVGCKNIRRNMFCLYKRLFPNAVVLGYHCSGPAGDKDAPLIKDFFDRMNWNCLLKDSCSENYKKEIVKAWKEAVEKTWDICKKSKPGYYYTTDEDEHKFKVELNKYYGKIIEKDFSFKEGKSIIKYTLEKTVLENFESLPYKVGKNNVYHKYHIEAKNGKYKDDLYTVYEMKQKNVEFANAIITMVDDEKINDGEGKLFINHGYNYLVDDAYRSEYRSIVSDEDDIHEHEEIGYIPIQQSTEPFFLIYEPPYREKDVKRRKKYYENLMKAGVPYWRSISPEGKLYNMETCTVVYEDEVITE